MPFVEMCEIVYIQLLEKVRKYIFYELKQRFSHCKCGMENFENTATLQVENRQFVVTL